MENQQRAAFKLLLWIKYTVYFTFANNNEKVVFWDIACGSGWMSQYVAASLSDSLSRIVASDIDSMAVRSVRVQKYIAQTTRISRVSLIYITL